MEVFIITPFPDSINVLIENNIANQGIKKRLLNLEVVNLRDFTSDNYKKIDDEPYGGGSGMVMMCKPLFDAIEYCISKSKKKPKVIFPSPKGKVLNHSISSDLSKESSIVFICGHYKGIDERVIEKYVTHEYSLGDFVMTNGEVPVMAMLDSIIRLIPGTLNKLDSALTDSFTSDLLDHPHYTQPRKIGDMVVPEILISGHHGQIDTWRKMQKEKITMKKRPDIWEKFQKLKESEKDNE